MACDICENNDGPLIELLETHQTTEIKQICYACEAIVSRKKRSLVSMVLNISTELLKRFMVERRNSKARNPSAQVTNK